jgi:hypothetical protein
MLIDKLSIPQGADLEMAKEAEKSKENRIVFMADVWLDLDDTFDKLATVFEGAILLLARCRSRIP